MRVKTESGEFHRRIVERKKDLEKELEWEKIGVRVMETNGVGRTGVFCKNRGARKVRRVVGYYEEIF